MIFVRDKGQMCNNILQYGHMYAWGREHNRKTVSMRFAYKYQYFKICNTKYHWFITYLFAKWGAGLGLIPRVTFPFEKGADIAPLEQKLLTYRNCIAEGWRVEFPELFLKYKSEIIDLFSFKPEISEKVKARMKECDNESALRLGVHIRRGDYARWMEGKFFYEDEVYINYIKEFVDSHKGENVAVYLCSNDPLISVERYRHSIGMTRLFQLNGNGPEDLCLLSLCDYIIGPPSTYSLVGSLYHDAKIHWMFSKDANELKDKGFQNFNQLFTQIL